jgi:predicted lipid-binding transport protein (Tim44 family)
MDIIFFAALAFYIFYRLNAQLGKIDDEEKKQIQERIAKKREEILEVQKQIIAQQQKIVGSSSTGETQNKSEEKFLSNLDDSSKQTIRDIFQSCNISAEFFSNGAKSSFEMIIKAFAGDDLEVLKFLLSEKIYQGFESAINQRKSREQTLVTNLISIEKAEIISVLLQENFASIVMKFTSKQINYLFDNSGQIIDGKKGEINEITDIWTFKKDVKSSDPNWLLYATSNT